LASGRKVEATSTHLIESFDVPAMSDDVACMMDFLE
jgi:hypothetical protein